MSQGYTVTAKQIQLTRQGAQAVAYKGPTDNQLSKILNSPAESAIPSMKIVRWMAAQILIHNGYAFSTIQEKKQ
jgi:hypothetical protein